MTLLRSLVALSFYRLGGRRSTKVRNFISWLSTFVDGLFSPGGILFTLSSVSVSWQTPMTVTRSSPDKPPVAVQALPPEPFEYYDAGNHWCKNCNATSGSMFDFFTHLHSKTHRKVCGRSFISVLVISSLREV